MKTAALERLRSSSRREPALFIVPFYAALVAAAAVRVSLWLLLVPLLVAALAVVVGVGRGAAPSIRRNIARLPPGTRWLPFAWLLLLFASNQKFTARALAGDSVTSAGGFSIENVLELGLYAVLAAIMLLRWPGRADVRRPLPWVALLAWPAWAFASAAWSLQPVYSGVRGAQLAVPVVFAVFTARRMQALGDDGRAMLSLFARIFVDLCTALSVFAFVAPPASVAESSRLTWYGIHPLVAAEILAAATVVLVVGGPKLIGARLSTWALRLGLVAVAFARTQGRTSIVAVLLTVVVVIWVAGRGRPLQRWVGVLYYLALVAGGLILFSQQLLVAATRGEGIDRLTTLDSRIPLWQFAVSQLKSVGDVFVGFGIGTSRLLLSDEIAFAGQAHNSFVEALLDTGVIGLVLLLLWLIVVGRRLASATFTAHLPRHVHAVLAGLFGLSLVASIGSPELASPSFSWSLTCFLAAFVLRDPGDQRGVSARERSRAASRATAPRSAATRSMTSGV